jgi:hypothetical protein
VVLIFRWVKIKPQIILSLQSRICVKFDYDDGLSSKPIAIDRFNASVTRAMDLHLLKQDTKEEDGEHIFKSNLKKLKILLQNKMD